MSRPKDENGRSLPPPHLRLPNVAALEQRAIFKISEDARVAHLALGRKLALVRQAIDHCVDGDKVPKWIGAPDNGMKTNHVLMEVWRAAVAEVRAGLKVAA